MIVIRVQSLGAMKALLGSREIQVEMPAGARLADLLARLSQQCGPEFDRQVNVDGDWPDLRARIFVNGRDHFTLQHLDTVLQDGDRVMLLPPMAGG